uniref:Integrin beta n=1 Tax=Ditylenchus dipsaci TaxID=166011 RepID=A0A915EUL7_9BILA
MTPAILSKCLDGKTMSDTNVCDGIKVGDEVSFEVTLEATHCVKQRDFELFIGPSGLDEVLKLNVHVICDCDCEEEIVYNAPECHGHGNLVCGICQCIEGYKRQRQSDLLRKGCVQVWSLLLFPRANPEEIKLCGGHGTCNCGVCQCEPGFTGPACECPLSKETCMSKNGKECNGHGECICGKCRCFTDENGQKYSGPFCDICPTCPTKCVEYKPCVMFKELPVLNVTDSETWNECQFVDPADDCTFYFLYYYDGYNNLTVWVKEEKDCPAHCLSSSLFIYDRREYARFEKDRLNARWDTNENPLYKQATTTFKNPVYAGDAKIND